MTEIPTTEDVKSLKDFQNTFLTKIRPIAEQEIEAMPPAYAANFAKARDKLVPGSIVIDIMLYLTHILCADAAQLLCPNAKQVDLGRLMRECEELDPYWQATRCMALAVKVFGQDPEHVMEYLSDANTEATCYVCGAESRQPLTLEDRRNCRGGCPECCDTIEAVFPN